MVTVMSRKSSTLAAFVATASVAAFAQVTVVPRIAVTETLTDNVRLVAVDEKSDQVTQISPGIRIDIKGARLKTYFDYALTQVVYAQGTASNRSQNSLNTFGTLEAIDNWAFLDFSGAISQQAISAFGVQSIDNVSVNANRAEVSTYRLSPYLRGQFGSTATYEARYTQSITSGGNAVLGSDVTTSDGVVRLAGGSAFRSLGWSADATRQNIDYSAGRTTESDRLNLGLSYAITPQVNVSANTGQEKNNFTSLEKRSYATHGFGVNWNPSERTKLSISRNQRSFGKAHNLSFEHRTGRTVWRISDSKDVSATPSQTGLLANTEIVAPSVVGSFLTSAVSLQRRQDVSVSLLGVRDTITFTATTSENTRLDTLSLGQDDLNNSSVVNQRGFSFNYAHRLTPDYSLGVTLSQQDTAGVLSSQDSTLRALNVSVSGKVGHRTSATLGARRIVSSGSSVPYTENALTGNLNVQF